MPKDLLGFCPCYSIVLPGRKSGFRARFRPDSSRESFKSGPPRPAGGPILRVSRRTGPEARLPAQKDYRVEVHRSTIRVCPTGYVFAKSGGGIHLLSRTYIRKLNLDFSFVDPGLFSGQTWPPDLFKPGQAQKQC